MKRESDRRAGAVVALVSLVLASPMLAACGSKTGLYEPRFDAGPDAPPPPDAGPPIDAFMPDGGPPPPDRCIELIPDEPPKTVEVSFLSRIQTAEIYFLVDVTGSMGEEIAQIRSGLRDSIVPGIRALIPGVRFSVARYADYPVDPYGSAGGGGVPRDDVYRIMQESTTSLDAITVAVNQLDLQSGGDVPEATTEALFISATGMTPDPSIVPPPTCPPDTVGFPCFAPGGSRIFLLFTDAPFHDGPSGAEPYGPDLPFPHATYSETVTALRGIGAKVLGLYSGPPGEAGWEHLRRVARDTGAVRPGGEPIVFDIGAGGSSLGPDVIEAVRTLVEDVPLDVDALVEDWPGDDLDANEFVVGIRAVSADPPSGATVLPDRFDDVSPGTRVLFSILLANERIPQIEIPQRYRMTVVLRGDTVTRLTETVVDIVIPADDGTGCEDLFPGVMD